MLYALDLQRKNHDFVNNYYFKKGKKKTFDLISFANK